MLQYLLKMPHGILLLKRMKRRHASLHFRLRLRRTGCWKRDLAKLHRGRCTRFVFMMLREPNNRGDKDEYQTEKSSCTRICHYLQDHGDTMREDSVLDACDQLAAKLSWL